MDEATHPDTVFEESIDGDSNHHPDGSDQSEASQPDSAMEYSSNGSSEVKSEVSDEHEANPPDSAIDGSGNKETDHDSEVSDASSLFPVGRLKELIKDFTPPTLRAPDFSLELDMIWRGFRVVKKARRVADGLAVVIREECVVTSRNCCIAPEINKQIAILEKLNHPGLVEFIGHYLNDHAVKLVFAYNLDDKTLEDIISHRNMSEVEAAHYTIQIAEALEYIHSFGFILRSLIAYRIIWLEGHRVKIADFDSIVQLDHNGQAFGDYAAGYFHPPEMVLGQGYGTPADWWGLGLLFYCMVTWRDAFAPAMWQLFQGNPTLSQTPKFPRYLSEPTRVVILQLLNKDPNERLSSVAELKAMPIYSNVWPPRPHNNLFSA